MLLLPSASIGFAFPFPALLQPAHLGGSALSWQGEQLVESSKDPSGYKLERVSQAVAACLLGAWKGWIDPGEREFMLRAIRAALGHA